MEISMKKLTLELENLVVESFDTSFIHRPQGTVFGEQGTRQSACTCPGLATCAASCNGTCGPSCGGCYSDVCHTLGSCECEET
jgi:hypothetical protein